MDETISSAKLKFALEACLRDSRLAMHYADATEAAKRYLQLRFFMQVYPGDLTQADYEAFRDSLCEELDRDDIQSLLQHENELSEVRYLTSLLRRPAIAAVTPAAVASAAGNAPAPEAPGSSAAVRPREPAGYLLPVCALLAAVVTAVFALARRSASHGADNPPEEATTPVVVSLGGDMPSARRTENVSESSSDQVAADSVDDAIAVPELAAAEEAPADPMPVAMTTNTAAADPAVAPSNAAPAVVAPPETSMAEVVPQIDDSKTLPSIGGIVFGEAAKDATIISKVLVGDGSSFAECGIGLKARSMELKKNFSSFGKCPVLGLTPKTRRVYSVEFVGERTEGAEEALRGLVETLERRFGEKAISSPSGTNLLFRLGRTTVRVGLADGRLRLEAEHAGVRDEVRGESAIVRHEMKADLDDGKCLDAADYPNGGMAWFKDTKFAKGTPRSFCGFAFGALPPPGADRRNHANGTRFFYVNYRGLKSRPFKGFAFGRAECRPADGALYAVELHSDGGPVELTDGDYLENLRATLERHYGVKPETDAGATGCVYHVGDVDISLAPDPKGGFLLRAENHALAP